MGRIVVLVTGYNCKGYVETCLESIRTQTHDDFICYITDDMSTDGTPEEVLKFIEKYNDERFKLIVNDEKRYQGGNYDLICRDTEGVYDDDIAIEVDLDDYLSDENVFFRVNDYYSKGDIWITNGQFRYLDGRQGFSKPVNDLSKVRQGAFTMSHLRTWKVFLWRAIPPNDLRDENGNWWTAACDTIFMFDMVEMAGLEHYKFLPEVSYIYNSGNPLNEDKHLTPTIHKMIMFTRNKKQRSRLIR